MSAIAAELRPAISKPLNKKLGPGIFAWSLPAKETCPGATEACLAVCYALRGRFRMGNLKHLYQRNEEFSRTAEFSDWMVAQLVANSVEIMRLHVSGDFYDVEYVEKWYDIIRRNPQVRFFGYTHSWSVDGFTPVLRKLARCANLKLWYSVDPTSGTPAVVPAGVRLAWLANSDEEAHAAPAAASLVFRNKPATLMKKSKTGVTVCPHENGLQGVARPTCTMCKLCFRDQK